jgi:hypothetical protein
MGVVLGKLVPPEFRPSGNATAWVTDPLLRNNWSAPLRAANWASASTRRVIPYSLPIPATITIVKIPSKRRQAPANLRVFVKSNNGPAPAAAWCSIRDDNLWVVANQAGR